MSHESRRSSPGSRPKEAAGHYLEQCLERDRRYSVVWEQKTDRPSRKGVNRDAVARVIMEYLNMSGEADIDNERSIKDRVGRALDGRVFTPRTLQWFVESFGITGQDEDVLRDLLRDETSRWNDSVFGESGPNEGRPYRTISLLEFHKLNGCGVPEFHETLQTIQALDHINSLRYTFDTREASVETVWGGTQSAIEHYRGTFYKADILFDRALRPGEKKSLKFVTRFNYSEPPDPCFRRGATQRIDNVQLRVEFSESRMPRCVWWCRWENEEAPVVEYEECKMDEFCGVDAIHSSIQNTYVGFTWRW